MIVEIFVDGKYVRDMEVGENSIVGRLFSGDMSALADLKKTEKDFGVKITTTPTPPATPDENARNGVERSGMEE